MQPPAQPNPTLPKWSIVMIALFLVGVGLAYNARPIYHTWLDWRGGQAAQLVADLIDSGDKEKAITQGSETYRNYPSSTPVIRVTARLLAEVSGDYSTAAGFLKRIIATEAATDEDRLLLADYLAKSGDIVGAQAAVAALPPALQNGRRALEASASIAAFMGDRAAAEAYLRKALQAEPDNPQCQLRLAILEDSTSFVTSTRSTATQRIWDLAKRPDNTGLQAIQHLANSESLTTPDAAQLFSLIDAHPQATDPMRYEVLAKHHKLRPLDTDTLVIAELARQKTKPVDELSPFFRWLVTVGHHQDILKRMPMDTILKDTKAMLLYIDALSAGNEWRTLITLMQNQRLPISPATRSLVLGQGHGRLDDTQTDTAAQFLRETISTATSKEESLVTRAAQTAEALGLTSLAREGYKKLLGGRPDGRVPLLERLLELARRDRDAVAIVDNLKSLVSARPGFQPYADQLNYYRLISGIEMELASASVQPTSDRRLIAKETPVIAAMSARRFGQENATKDALATVTSPETLSPGMRAVLSAFYSDIGQPEKAWRLAETVTGTLENGRRQGDKRSLLLPEELQLLELGVK